MASAEVSVDPADPRRITMVLHEGRKRQIRRMVRAVGNEVAGLRRVAIGPLELGDLPEGQVRALTDEESAALRRAVGLTP